MAETTLKLPKPGSAPTALAPIGRTWGRLSPSLIPLLAVLTAMLITIPFMILTGGRGDARRGLAIAGTAYSALIEGALGIAVNDQLSPDDFNLLRPLANSGGGLTPGGLRALDRGVSDLATVGVPAARRYADVFARFPDLDEDALTDLGESVPLLRELTPILQGNAALIIELEGADRGEVRDLAESIVGANAVDPAARETLEALAPSAADQDDSALIDLMRVVNEYGIVRLSRLLITADTLSAANIALDAPVLDTVAEMATLPGGLSLAQRAAGVVEPLADAGIDDTPELARQIATIRVLYEQGLLSGEDIAAAIDNELPAVLEDNLIVRRPGERLIVDRATAPAGIVNSDSGTPDDITDDRADSVYLRLGGSALLFFPANLESMIVRAIPFIIAGLAVALGFKAGLFNIGAEGQLYAGATLAAWVGFSPIFAGLPIFVHLPLVIVVGLIGGGLWGAIPGALKAFTGAHEVIVTIMLNYIAVLFVDWLIKSTNPVLLLDPTASTPRTPFMNLTAQLPRFDTIPVWLFIAAGILITIIGLLTRRERLRQDIRYAIRPLVNGVLVIVGGLFLAWITVRGALHIGLVIMLMAVAFTDWFLTRTTLGFELRTVGENPDAAKYAGMSVPRNIILAMALSGALAGLAGTIEVTGVQLNMQPEFFAGLGFDAIAVALLARNNIRNMIPAGLLWGALLAGAGLMQLRADISIDLVKIIQALIIMFVAADAIIRYVWAIPKPTDKTPTIAAGWGK